jgi:hypothetical protein
MKKWSQDKLKIDVYGSGPEATGWETVYTCFPEALEEFAYVNYWTDDRYKIRRSLYKKFLRLTGRRKFYGDFGIVISGGHKLSPHPTACWNVWETTQLPVAQKKYANP